MADIAEHRAVFLQALAGCEGRRLCRDVATLETPWGRVSSRAIYRYDDGGEWIMVVDEFGEPTNAGRELYASFRPNEPVDTIVRITNKNQLLLGRDRIVQLTPMSWTLRFLELSALYDLLRRLPSTYPHPSSLQRNGISPFAALVDLAWRGGNRRDVLYGLRERSRKLDGLPIELQALLFVGDSDLGKESSPFLELDGWHPASLNRLSRWRCWAAQAAIEDVFSLLMPPVAFAGEDIYRRAIWGATPQARIRHLCVAESELKNFGDADIYRIDYQNLWLHLQETIERTRKDRDPHCQLAGGVFRDEFAHGAMRRIEFWLTFWSHHMQEVLVLGDAPLERVFEVTMTLDTPLPIFQRAPTPMWTAGQRITPTDRLHHWMVPFYPAEDGSELDDTPRRETRRVRTKGARDVRKT